MGGKEGRLCYMLCVMGLCYVLRDCVMCYDLFDASYLIAAVRTELHFIIGGFSKD